MFLASAVGFWYNAGEAAKHLCAVGHNTVAVAECFAAAEEQVEPQHQICPEQKSNERIKMYLHIAERDSSGGVLMCLFLIVLACGSGYWMARFLPVRFTGEKVLINPLVGSLAALATFGLDKVMQEQVQREQILLPIGWFLLQGIAGEITVQVASWRRRTKF